MADDVDLAQDREEIHRRAALHKTLATAIEPGYAGVCEECGEEMPRLVGGRCGYCRDGRTWK